MEAFKLPKYDFSSIFNPKKEIPKLNFTEFCKEMGLLYTIYPKQLQMCEFALEMNGIPKLVLAMRHIGKTELLAVYCVAYRLLYNNNYTTYIISDTFSKAKDILYELTKVLENMEQRGWIAFDVKNKTQLRVKGSKKKEPTVSIGSVKSTLRGKHPDYIIFDDPLTLEKKDSQANRLIVQRSYSEAYSLTSNILVIGQPTHPLDLYETLRSSPKIPKFEVWNGDIPELTKDTNAMLEAGLTKADIAANYLGYIDASTDMPFYDLKTSQYDNSEKISGATAFIDFSHGLHDTCAVSIVFLKGTFVYALGYAKKLPWTAFLEEYIPKMKKLGITLVNYEANTSGYEPDNICRNLGIYSSGFWTGGIKINKILKVLTISKQLILLNDIDNVDNQEYLKQIKFWQPQNNILDDAPDSLAMCLNAMNLIYTGK